MTKSDVLQSYASWVGSPVPREIPGIPFANLDVCETDTQLVNRLFYLVPETSSGELRCFFYYEEFFFTKDSKGNLNLVESSLHLFNP